jgi:hypothetical protein
MDGAGCHLSSIGRNARNPLVFGAKSPTEATRVERVHLTDGRRSPFGRMLAGMKRRVGQAMLEYSLLTWVLVAAMFVLPFVGVPGKNSGGKNSMFYLLMQAYQTYNNSYYFALCAPLP